MNTVLEKKKISIIKVVKAKIRIYKFGSNYEFIINNKSCKLVS
jgi:hypothetical protein